MGPEPSSGKGSRGRAGLASVLVVLQLVGLLLSLPVSDSAASGSSIPGLGTHQSVADIRSPIRIDGDEEFTAANGVTRGHGVPGDPYVIEGWTIDASQGHGILIRNTEVPFVVLGVNIRCRAEPFVALWLDEVRDAELRAVSVEGCPVGLRLLDSRNVTVADGHIVGARFRAMEIARSEDVRVLNQDLEDNEGLAVYALETTGLGVRASRIARNGGGVVLGWTTAANLSQNAFVRNGVILLGTTPSHFASHEMGTTNLIEGRPLLYHRNCSNLTLEGGLVGQLILANCTRVTASNLRIADTDWAVQLLFAQEVRLEGSVLTHSAGGVNLYRVKGAVLSGNQVTSNRVGVQIRSSTALTLTENEFADNLLGAVWAFESSHIQVHRNNFLENGERQTFPFPFVRQVIDFGGAESRWDAGYPDGGNYWSDYGGEDLCSGPEQDVCPQPDGLGDVLHPVGITSPPAETVADRYPLMEPPHPVNAPPAAELSVAPVDGDIQTPFRLNASGSSDAEDPQSVLEFRWDFQDDGTWDTSWTSEAVSYRAYPRPGVYFVRMEVRDGGGRSNQTIRQVTVMNTPPVASFQVRPDFVMPGTPVRLEADVADREDLLQNLRVRWDWEDDGVWDTDWSPAKATETTYHQSGRYTVRLQVKDTHGGLAEATQTVVVLNVPLLVGLSLTGGIGAVVALVYLFRWRVGARRGEEGEPGPPSEASPS